MVRAIVGVAAVTVSWSGSIVWPIAVSGNWRTSNGLGSYYRSRNPAPWLGACRPRSQPARALNKSFAPNRYSPPPLQPTKWNRLSDVDRCMSPTQSAVRPCKSFHCARPRNMKSNATSKAFPNSKAHWQAVLAAAPASAKRTGRAQEAAIESRSVVVRSGGMAAVRTALQARKPGQRGPQKTPTKKLVSLRLSPEVLSYFRGTRLCRNRAPADRPSPPRRPLRLIRAVAVVGRGARSATGLTLRMSSAAVP